MKNFCLLIIFISISHVGFAQKTVKVCEEYTYYFPENISLQEAKLEAFRRAKYLAIVKEFDETIYQNNISIIKNENGKSNTDFYSIGGSEARGEWIETTKEEVINTSYDDKTNMSIITVKVCGKARERKNSGVEFSSKLLRNGTDAIFESSDFKENDTLYISFRAASDGYLCVYLFDGQTVQCILPYNAVSDGVMKIQHDKNYVFFDPYDKEVGHLCDGKLYLTCQKEVEYNDIYIIFSPNNFTKSNNSILNENTLLSELSFKDFQKWLTEISNKDKDLKIEQKNIKIIKNR